METLKIIFILFWTFIGYIVGRWSDNYLNFWIRDPKWLPDHWIYGLLIMAGSFWLLNGNLELAFFCFGFGLFVSDLKDFIHLKFYGSDNKNKEDAKFWHID